MDSLKMEINFLGINFRHIYKKMEMINSILGYKFIKKSNIKFGFPFNLLEKH